MEFKRHCITVQIANRIHLTVKNNETKSLLQKDYKAQQNELKCEHCSHCAWLNTKSEFTKRAQTLDM